MPIVTRRCTSCRTKFELLSSHGGQLSSLAPGKDLDDLTCPACGAGDAEIVIGAATGKLASLAGAKYPYVDRGLGCLVRDVNHHRWLLRHYPDGREREVALVHADGFDHQKVIDDQRYAQLETVRDYHAYIREMTEGPNREDYARSLAFAREHVEQFKASQAGKEHVIEVPDHILRPAPQLEQ